MTRKILLSLSLMICALTVSAQNVRDIRINEFMVINESNLVDRYGNHEAWVELYNTSHSNINIAGCYLSVEQGNSTMTYRIPTNDHRTEIAPLDYMIFFCEGTPSKGTFHTNFTLDKTGELAFLNASKELIDQVKYNVADQEANVSMALTTVDDELVWVKSSMPTPITTNEKMAEKQQYEIFAERDPSGAVLALTAMSVVFSALLMLFIGFKLMGVVMLWFANRKKGKKAQGVVAEKTIASNDEEVAAIALAIQLYQEDLHDIESTVLTINRVARTYSPWSSKIYGINQLPNRKK